MNSATLDVFSTSSAARVTMGHMGIASDTIAKYFRTRPEIVRGTGDMTLPSEPTFLFLALFPIFDAMSSPLVAKRCVEVCEAALIGRRLIVTDSDRLWVLHVTSLKAPPARGYDAAFHTLFAVLFPEKTSQLGDRLAPQFRYPEQEQEIYEELTRAVIKCDQRQLTT